MNIAKLVNLKLPLILASKSPRRRRLLEQLGLDFEVIPSSVDEDIGDHLPPEHYAKKLALAKAEEIAGSIDYDAIVLGSDTIVVLDDRIINKPGDEEDAVRMLKTLSGRTHTVYSGIALVDTSSDRKTAEVQTTKVTFRELADDEIRAYVVTGSPMDKAGAYGIQDDFGAVFVSNIEGCYYNIVGLPLELLYTTMRQFLK